MYVTKAAENSQKSIAYIRVSSKRQVDEGVSMEAQKRRILEYARFKGLNLADDDIIIEEGVSGGPFRLPLIAWVPSDSLKEF